MPRTLSVLSPIPQASGPIPGGARCLRVVNIDEATGTASAKIRIWNNSGPTGVLACPITLEPSESVRERWDYGEIVLDVGCFIELVSGQVEGCISLQAISPGQERYGPEPDEDELLLRVELQGA